MNRSSLSTEELKEIYEDACTAFQCGNVSEDWFRLCLGSLGYNATDIEDLVKFYRPAPPENDSDGEDSG